MARFKRLRPDGQASLGELLGLSQAGNQVSQRLDLRMVREQAAPLADVARTVRRRRQGLNPLGLLAQFLWRLFGSRQHR